MLKKEARRSGSLHLASNENTSLSVRESGPEEEMWNESLLAF